MGPALSVALLRPASDRRLVEHVRGGSEAAFEVLFDRHHPAVLAFCKRILRSADEAEDAAQHTFLAAYRELAGKDREIELRPWLYTVARHRCLTVLSARRGRPLEEGAELGVDRLVGDVTTREDLRGILADVARLPEEQRVALVLALLGDLPHAEIARSLGCSPAKVKALVFQARESLAAGRAARDTSCADIRGQLATARGASLRRAVLRRHLSECAGCRMFRDAVRADRRRLHLFLPLPPFAGLKRGLLALLGSSAPGGAAVGSGAGLAVAALAAVGVPVAVNAAAAPGDARERALPVARVTPAPSAAPSAGRAVVRVRDRRVPVIVARREPRAQQSPAHQPRQPRPAAPDRSPEPVNAAETHAPAALPPKPSAQPKPADRPKPPAAANGPGRPRPATPTPEDARGRPSASEHPGPPATRPEPPNRPPAHPTPGRAEAGPAPTPPEPRGPPSAGFPHGAAHGTLAGAGPDQGEGKKSR